VSISAEASQEAAEYIAALRVEFAPVVVDEFKDKVHALTEDAKDRTQDLMDLIENHDVVHEPRTMDAWKAALRAMPDTAPAGKPKPSRAPMKKSDSGGDYGGYPVMVFGMAAASQGDAAPPPSAPVDASLAGGNPPPLPPVQAPAPEDRPEPAGGDPRGTYAGRALRALTNFWRS
jgi:hypothetical protein